MTSSLSSDSRLETTKSKSFHLVFLPGLHGTAELFCGLNSAISKSLEVSFSTEVSFTKTLINYPITIPQSYESLKQWLTKELKLELRERSQKIILIAESFSSPLAIMLADEFPDQIEAVVLGSGFYRSPLNSTLSYLPTTPIFKIPIPKIAVRYFLTGNTSTDDLIQQVRNTVSAIPARVLSERLKSVLTLKENNTKSHPQILLLQAQYDALIPLKAQKQLEKHLPQAKSYWINSPHLIFQAHPEICSRHIIAFLSSCCSI